MCDVSYLYSLAQPHFVCEDTGAFAVPALEEPVEPLNLIVPQLPAVLVLLGHLVQLLLPLFLLLLLLLHTVQALLRRHHHAPLEAPALRGLAAQRVLYHVVRHVQ